MSIAKNSPFFESLEKMSEEKIQSDFQRKAWDCFKSLGLPDSSSDPFRYVPLEKLYRISLAVEPTPLPSVETIQRHVAAEAEGSYIVFANGRLCPELSQIPASIAICSFEKALEVYRAFLKPKLDKYLKQEKDPFSILSLALGREGLFCYLPPKTKLEKPLQIICYGDGASSYNLALVHFFLSSETELKTICTIVGDGVHHTCIDVSLEDKAIWSHLDISGEGGGIHLGDLRATLKSSSCLKHLTINNSKRLTRNRLHIGLLGEQADALLQGLWNLEDKHQSHTHVRVEHLAPSACSLQKYKGVLNQQARSSFKGEIYIHPRAQKTRAYQLNRHLLLSEGSIAHAKPNLEIYADDVKASHGATMSKIDEEQLFYLQSRGLTKETASNLLLQGFVQEMLDQIPYPSLRHGFTI